MIANPGADHIVATVRLNWNRVWVFMLPFFLLLTAGCGGFTASPSVSPAMFLLPGLGKNMPQVPAAADLAADAKPVDTVHPAEAVQPL